MSARPEWEPGPPLRRSGDWPKSRRYHAAVVPPALRRATDP